MDDTIHLLHLVIEVMPERLISYLTVRDITNLSFVSKSFKNLILKHFSDIYNISNGLTSDRHQFFIVEKICFDLTQSIYNEEFFDSVLFDYHFDCEENFSGLLKQFRHLSLFSVCLHFLRCIRSCEHVWGGALYCRFCSRVRDNEFKT